MINFYGESSLYANLMIMERTVTFDHERFNYVMSNHLKIGMADPVSDSGFGSGEKVVQDGDFMTEKHQTIDKMRADEACSTRHQDAHSRGRGKKFDGRETRERGVRYRMGIWMVDRFRLISGMALSESGMLFVFLSL